MKHRTAMTIVCALFCAAFTMHAVAGGPYTLRLNLQQGKTYLYSDVTRAEVTQEMMGQEMKSSTVSKTVSRIALENVQGDKSLSAVMSLDSVVLSVKSARMDTTMVMTDVMGKRSRIVLSPLGKVISRSIIDSIGKAGAPMRGASGRESARFHVFSEAPVVVGGTWTALISDTAEVMGGKMANVATMAYALAGEEEKAGRKCVKITYTGTMQIEGKGSMMGMEIFTEGKGTVTGTFYFDPAAGIMVAEESKTESDMTAAMTGQQNMTIPISSSSTTTRALRAIEESAK
jgi:hypothetical protein